MDNARTHLSPIINHKSRNSNDIIRPMASGVANLNPNYNVVTSVYEGPLDLLLQLIEHAELDITRLALSHVTDQYLEHMRAMTAAQTDLPAEEVSSFLVIAARLLQIKSEALLPRPPVREAGEEDPGDALARQLITYKRFKELSHYLARREAAGLRGYFRNAPAPQVDFGFDLSGVSLDELADAARQIFSQLLDPPALSSVVAPPRITIREKIRLIAAYLRLNRRGAFPDLLPPGVAEMLTGTLTADLPAVRLEVVVTFLALLELVKRQLIEIHQEGLFAPIEFEPSESWQSDIPDEANLDIEFGE